MSNMICISVIYLLSFNFVYKTAFSTFLLTNYVKWISIFIARWYIQQISFLNSYLPLFHLSIKMSDLR